jgi:hypothetical protein
MSATRSSLVALLIAATLALASPAMATDDWRAFETEVGRFKVDLPAEPKQLKKERWFPVSSFVSRVYKAYVGDDIFGVNHTDLPGAVLFFAGKKKVFNSTRDGFLEESKATQVSFEKADFVGRPGRKLVYDIPAQGRYPALRGLARMCFEGNRLYVFYAEVSESRAQTDIDRFFDSIEISDDGE